MTQARTPHIDLARFCPFLIWLEPKRPVTRPSFEASVPLPLLSHLSFLPRFLLNVALWPCSHLPIFSASYWHLSPFSFRAINSFSLGLTPRHVLNFNHHRPLQRQVTLPVEFLKNLFYCSSNGGIRLYIDGCQSITTGARLRRETT